MSTEDKPAYSPGLAGVVAGESAICWVDPDAGLLYRGYDIHDLAARSSYEDVVWLLLNGELPDMEQLAMVTRELAREMERTDDVAEPVLIPGNPVKLSAVAEGPETRIPWVGEHTFEVLREELGLDDDELAKLAKDGAITGSPTE